MSRLFVDLATCWYCDREIIGFRYKIAENDCDIECANKEINRSLDMLGRLMGEIDQFVGFGLGYDKPEFFWYIFAENEASVLMIREQCSAAQIGFSLYPLIASMPFTDVPEPTVALPDRIVLGGVSIGHLLGKTTGTLGGVVRMGDQRYAISTSGTLAPEGSKLGDLVVQPSVEDSPYKMYSMGKLSVVSKLAFGSINDLDAAIATVDPNVPTSPRIREIGRPNNVSEPEIGMNVRKSGRTTGFTEGKVLCTDVRIKIVKSEQMFILQDQFIVMSDTEEFARLGDEGSFVLDNNNDLVGMIQLAFHGMAVCARGSILLTRFGFEPPYCFEPTDEDF